MEIQGGAVGAIELAIQMRQGNADDGRNVSRSSKGKNGRTREIPRESNAFVYKRYVLA